MRSLQAIIGLITAATLAFTFVGRITAEPPVHVFVDPPFGAVCTAYSIPSEQEENLLYYVLIYQGPGGQVIGIATRTQYGVYAAARLDRVIVGTGTVSLLPLVNFPEALHVFMPAPLPDLFRLAPDAPFQVVSGPTLLGSPDIRDFLRSAAMAWCELAPRFLQARDQGSDAVAPR